MTNNIKLFEFSLENPEPVMDENYIKNGNLIISRDTKVPTSLMKNNLELLETIAAYSFAKKSNAKAMMNSAIEKVLKLVKSEDINYSEFVSFWSVVDLSHSIFKKLEIEKQKDVLKKIIEKYLDLRHELYSLHGYSSTTLQVGKDAKAHKENGNLGLNKVEKILETSGFQNCDSESISDFISGGDRKFLKCDKKGKKLFQKLLSHYKIEFSWSSSNEEKMPDFLIKYKTKLLILEHKHVREGGGGQNKQITEIIKFIESSEKEHLNIHYISFLDGIYFNLFTKPSSPKINNQLKNIQNNLIKNQKNYFVNTAGFKKLLQEFKNI